MAKLSDAHSGYYYRDREGKARYLNTYLCFLKDGKVERLHIDGFRKGRKVALEYPVPMDDLYPLLPPGTLIRKMMVRSEEIKYGLAIEHDNSHLIPLIPVSGKGIRVCLEPIAVTTDGSGEEYFIQDCELDDYPIYGLMNEELARKNVADWFSEGHVPEIIFYPGTDKGLVETYAAPYAREYLADFFLRAKDEFLRNIDSGLHVMVGNTEYMVPRSDTLFSYEGD